MKAEEIEKLKAEAEQAIAEAKTAREEAENYKKAAENAEAVNKVLQEQIQKVEEPKTENLTVKVGGKKGIIRYPAFRYKGVEYKAETIAKSTNKELLEELVLAEVIRLVD